MTNSIIILDAGNSIIKGKTAGREVAYPHALRKLTGAQFDRIINRSQGTPGSDYLLINDEPYVVGESAARHAATMQQRTGSARYAADYYGLFVAATLARVYLQSGDVMLFGSHAPRDLEYRNDLARAALGDWRVLIDGRTLEWRVGAANTFEEPTGGLMNVVLAEDGQHYARTDINGGSALVIDIGGHTTDWQGVKPGGEVDYEAADSIGLGVLDVVRDFEQSFRANHREVMKGSEGLTSDQLSSALNSGELHGGGRIYDCADEASEAANILLNRVADSIQAVIGGVFQYQTVILTGGGCALLETPLREMLDHGNVILADRREDLHLANVRGGLKLWRLYDAMGVL